MHHDLIKQETNTDLRLDFLSLQGEEGKLEECKHMAAIARDGAM